MSLHGILKKLNKSYSVVVIPFTNDNVRRLAVRAPFMKLLLVFLLLSVVVAFNFFASYGSTPESTPAEEEQISKAQLQQQVNSLTQVIEQQRQTLALANSQLEQYKTESLQTKEKIEAFTRMYSDITDRYIEKNSRGATPESKKVSNIVSELSSLNSVVTDLNKSYSSNQLLTTQLEQTNDKLDKYFEAIPTFLPAKGVISSPFGMRKHPIKKVYKNHEGVDITSSKGDPIFAAASGTVEFAGYSKGYGYNVKIDHGNGIRTIYAHSSKLLVKKGDSITKGQKIALVGSTGVSTGPHLHFEIRLGSTPVDPTQYIEINSQK